MRVRNFIELGLFLTIALFPKMTLDKEVVLPFSLPQKPSANIVANDSPTSVENQKEEVITRAIDDISLKTSSPVKLIIPSINLNSKVLALGKGRDGNMEVPSGKTKDVGWYKEGTIPGEVGSAVLDAHVFAAFSDLKNLKSGDDIYVVNSEDQKLHFVVKDAKNYELKSLSTQTLFAENNGERRLNLITCAGNLTADKSTYDHRLIVFAEYEGVEANG